MEIALGLVAIGAGLAIGVPGIGAGIGMGLAAQGAFESIARQPEVTGTVRTLLFIALAFTETVVIYGLVIALMLVTSGMGLM